MMTEDAIRTATKLLVEARRTGRRLDALPPSCRPSTVAEAEAIQAAVIAALGEEIAGWKVATLNGEVMGGAILASRALPSPARVPAAQMPLHGVEAEIAFRFDRDMKPRSQPYDYAEVAASVTALAAIEIVDSRFRDYRATPLLDRAADCVSNGGFVAGTLQPAWRGLDLVNIAVTLMIDGKPAIRKSGGHPAGDPLLPAVTLVNLRRTGAGVRAGQVMTTGTYTGLTFVEPGASVAAIFDGVGSAELSFVG
jgi:2-keto-4-pentenoate hydratase